MRTAADRITNVYDLLAASDLEDMESGPRGGKVGVVVRDEPGAVRHESNLGDAIVAPPAEGCRNSRRAAALLLRAR